MPYQQTVRSRCGGSELDGPGSRRDAPRFSCSSTGSCSWCKKKIHISTFIFISYILYIITFIFLLLHLLLGMLMLSVRMMYFTWMNFVYCEELFITESGLKTIILCASCSLSPKSFTLSTACNIFSLETDFLTGSKCLNLFADVMRREWRQTTFPLLMWAALL